MSDPVNAINLAIVIIGALAGWTLSIISAAFWLSGRFRALEVLLYKEIGKIKQQNEQLIKEHNDRLMILEMEVLGVTQHGRRHQSRPLE